VAGVGRHVRLPHRVVEPPSTAAAVVGAAQLVRVISHHLHAVVQIAASIAAVVVAVAGDCSALQAGVSAVARTRPVATGLHRR